MTQDIPEIQQRWSWLEIDLSAIRHNVEDARAQLQLGTKLLAVVKADGYGRDAVECARGGRPAAGRCRGDHYRAGPGAGANDHEIAIGFSQRMPRVVM